MFDVSFGELFLVLIIGLVVLGPERLPVAVRTVAGWIRTMRSLSTKVQSELQKEFKLQELQESLNKIQKFDLDNISPELKASMEELRHAAEEMRKTYQQDGNHIASLQSSLDESISTLKSTVDEVTQQVHDATKLHPIAENTPSSEQAVLSTDVADLESSACTQPKIDSMTSHDELPLASDTGNSVASTYSDKK